MTLLPKDSFGLPKEYFRAPGETVELVSESNAHRQCLSEYEFSATARIRGGSFHGSIRVRDVWTPDSGVSQTEKISEEAKLNMEIVTSPWLSAPLIDRA